MKTEKGWAITGTFGLYCGWWFRRKDAIFWHCKNLGQTWEECKKKGDRVIKVTIVPEG